jgi:hypothetical protein
VTETAKKRRAARRNIKVACAAKQALTERPKITPGDRRVLKRRAAMQDVKADAILRASAGESAAVIGRVLGYTRQGVHLWIQQWREGGRAKLFAKRGRPKKKT